MIDEEFNIEKIAQNLGIKEKEAQEIINQLMESSNNYPQQEVIKQILKSLEL